MPVTLRDLAPYYSRFRVAERLLLTGHSHQAWPDRAELGQRRAWEDAAEWVDKKWERAFERALSDYAGAGLLRAVALRYFNAAGCHPDGSLGEDHDPEEHLVPRAVECYIETHRLYRDK